MLIFRASVLVLLSSLSLNAQGTRATPQPTPSSSARGTTGAPLSTDRQTPSQPAPNPIQSQVTSQGLEIATLRAKIDELQIQNTELKKQLKDDESRIDFLSTRLDSKVDELQWATFDSAVPDHYDRVDSESGSFLVSLKTVEPYLDGFKVNFEIGNLSNAVFKGFTLRFGWSSREITDPYIYKTQTFTASLLPNRWNRVEVIIPNAKPSSVALITLKLSTNTVTFGQ